MNILIIMSDQHHPHFMGCAGHPVVETPNLDAIAREGTRFSGANCPSPLCGPSRMSFLTGAYPFRTGVYANGQPLPSDFPTFAHALTAAGYQTALIGRMHITGPDQEHGFQYAFSRDVTASTLGGGLLPLLDGLHAGSGPAGVTLSGPGSNAYHLYDDLIARRACGWLAESDPSRPFCMVVGFALPHNPFVCSEEDYERYKGRVEPPAVTDEEAARMHPAVRRAYEKLRVATREDARRALAAYCGSVTALDRRVGSILAALWESGRGGSTLVVYTSDHGEMAGEHGLWFKTCFYEGSVGVPLLMSMPGEIPAGGTLRECVNLVDLTATVLDLAGAEPLPEIDGRSFRRLWRPNLGAWDDTTYSEYGTRWAEPLLARMVRRGRMKYVYYHEMPELLFDLDNDPGERYNLAEMADYAAVKGELRALVLRDWDPAEVARRLDSWKRRNGVLYRAYCAAPPKDEHIYRPDATANYLLDVPSFKRDPKPHYGSY